MLSMTKQKICSFQNCYGKLIAKRNVNVVICELELIAFEASDINNSVSFTAFEGT